MLQTCRATSRLPKCLLEGVKSANHLERLVRYSDYCRFCELFRCGTIRASNHLIHLMSIRRGMLTPSRGHRYYRQRCPAGLADSVVFTLIERLPPIVYSYDLGIRV